jgi:hypothetical protein
MSAFFCIQIFTVYTYVYIYIHTHTSSYVLPTPFCIHIFHQIV